MEPSQLIDETGFDQAVKQVESNTAKHLYPLWMNNWRNNLSDASAGESLDRIYRRPKVERALIIGRGPSIYKHRHLELLAERGFPGKVVASDGALPLLSEHGAKADYSLTVDGNQIIQKWYKPQYRNACNEGFRVILPVTAHRATYNACMKSGMKVSWYIPELDTENFKNLTEVLQLQTISEDNPTGLSRLNGAGCSGNACIVFAATILNVREICMIGMDSGYSQDTPLSELHYHDNILAGCGYDKEKAAKLYKIYYSEAWQQYCVTDPVFEIYKRTAFSLFQHLQAGGVKIKNCSEGGCLTADGVETPSFREYLDSAT